MILENIDIDIDIDKAILQNIDIDKITNRFKFGISSRATWESRSLGVSESIHLGVLEFGRLECINLFAVACSVLVV